MRRVVLAAALLLAAFAAWQIIPRVATSVAKPNYVSAGDIERIAQAPSLHTYSAVGRTTFRHQGRSLTLRIKVLHEKPDKHRIEYLTAPLEGVTVVYDGTEAWRFDPKLRIATALDAYGSGEATELLLRNYVVQRAGNEHAAGRPAYVLLVKSRNGELKKRLWVDSSTHIILRSEDYDAKGKVKSATRFDSASYVRDISDSVFERPSDAEDMACFQGTGSPMSREQLAREVGFKMKTPSYVPGGYRLDGYRLYECPCGCGHKSAYVRYTDGLECISIFQCAAGSACMEEAKCPTHAVKCFVRGQTSVMTDKDVSAVVIGNLKPEELQKITESLE